MNEVVEVIDNGVPAIGDSTLLALAAGRKIPMERESEWQGFVTSSNRFVNRYEGYDLQIAAGIKSSGGGYRDNRLFSEDLY